MSPSSAGGTNEAVPAPRDARTRHRAALGRDGRAPRRAQSCRGEATTPRAPGATAVDGVAHADDAVSTERPVERAASSRLSRANAARAAPRRWSSRPSAQAAPTARAAAGQWRRRRRPRLSGPARAPPRRRRRGAARGVAAAVPMQHQRRARARARAAGDAPKQRPPQCPSTARRVAAASAASRRRGAYRTIARRCKGAEPHNATSLATRCGSSVARLPRPLWRLTSRLSRARAAAARRRRAGAEAFEGWADATTRRARRASTHLPDPVISPACEARRAPLGSTASPVGAPQALSEARTALSQARADVHEIGRASCGRRRKHEASAESARARLRDRRDAGCARRRAVTPERAAADIAANAPRAAAQLGGVRGARGRGSASVTPCRAPATSRPLAADQARRRRPRGGRLALSERAPRRSSVAIAASADRVAACATAALRRGSRRRGRGVAPTTRARRALAGACRAGLCGRTFRPTCGGRRPPGRRARRRGRR